jgi:hypothetical protein
VALTLALGLLVGFEREWSNKDTGARTFAMTALLGLLGSLLGPNLLLLGGAAVLILIVFANLRSLQVGKKLEATTSVSLLLIFMLGVLVGQGHLFTPVACSILVAMLLSDSQCARRIGQQRQHGRRFCQHGTPRQSYIRSGWDSGGPHLHGQRSGRPAHRCAAGKE